METIIVQNPKPVLSLITGVSFSNVSCWYDASRRDLKMDLIVPKNRQNCAPRPTIVWICGGAYQVVDRSVWLPQMMTYANAGYNIASIEYRTSNEARFPAPLIDVKAAVRYLRAHSREFCIDPDRIYAMGESAGGTMACLLGATADIPEYEQGDHLQFSSSVQGVVDFYGLTDLVNCVCQAGDTVPYWTLEALLGTGYTAEDAKKASAVFLVNQDTPPHMILHGQCDPLVPIDNSIALYNALKQHGITAQLLVIENAAHGDDRFYQESVALRVLEFLEQI